MEIRFKIFINKIIQHLLFENINSKKIVIKRKKFSRNNLRILIIIQAKLEYFLDFYYD